MANILSEESSRRIKEIVDKLNEFEDISYDDREDLIVLLETREIGEILADSGIIPNLEFD